MLTYYKRFLLIIIATLSPLLAQADTGNRNANFFLTVGRTFIEYEGEKENSAAAKVGFGYRFSDYVGTELYYIYYGQISERSDIGITDTLKSNAAVLNLIGYLPIGKSFDIYAKVGVSAWEWKATFPDIGEAKEDGTDPIYTLGFSYNVDYDSTVRLEYEVSEYDVLDYAVLAFGFQHNF